MAREVSAGMPTNLMGSIQLINDVAPMRERRVYHARKYCVIRSFPIMSHGCTKITAPSFSASYTLQVNLKTKRVANLRERESNLKHWKKLGRVQIPIVHVATDLHASQTQRLVASARNS
jgi:hypothetical protein